MCEELQQHFQETFQRPAAFLFSAPGRTELGGNHTDHQLGRVLAASVNLDTVAAVAENGSNTVHVLSEGHSFSSISLDDLAPRPYEEGSSSALIRGMLAGVAEKGHAVPGFDAYVSSRVLPGSGLSSSAALRCCSAQSQIIWPAPA